MNAARQGPETDMDVEVFRDYVRGEIGGRMKERRQDSAIEFYGAGDDDDDVELGRQVLRSLSEGGWSAPTWPRRYGGAGASPAQAVVIAEELRNFETPGLYAFSVGLNMVGPVLIEHGTEEQKARWLPSIRDGSEIWCQLFSEPDAGSDLASLKAVAVAAGNGWNVTGQKVWSSRAHYADWGLLLARTSKSENRHRGLSAFALDMGSPGVSVRPLRQMNGDAHFNEVFIDEVQVSGDCLIGGEGQGWAVAMTTLNNERANSGGAAPPFGGVPAVLELLKAAGPLHPLQRQRAARLICEMQVYQWTSLRARAARITGAAPGPEGSGGKLRLAHIGRSLAALAVDLGGLDSLTRGSLAETLVLTAPSLSIRGGTAEIQRDIIGERTLGLPREARG
jgi:alkylation response protein AidB-like acyl-CoA dehydrogenase